MLFCLNLSAQSNAEISIINGHKVVVIYDNYEYFISINEGKLVNKKSGKKMKSYIRRKTDNKPEFLRYISPILFKMI